MRKKVFDMTEKELLIRIDERVKGLQADFAVVCKRNGDLEKRVDKLEQWRMYVVGVASIIGAVASLVATKVFSSIFKN